MDGQYKDVTEFSLKDDITFMRLDDQQYYQYPSNPEISRVHILTGWLTS